MNIIPMTSEEFEALSPREKGYVVYMRGAWKEQPNIPRHYKPNEEDKKEYEHGGRQAVIEVQDNP